MVKHILALSVLGLLACASAAVAPQYDGGVSGSGGENGTAPRMGPGTTIAEQGTGGASSGGTGTGGATVIRGTGGSREDGGAPAGPEAGPELRAGDATATSLDIGRDLSPKDELFTIFCGSAYGETSMCPAPQMCAPSRYCQYTCSLSSVSPNQGCPDGLKCKASSLNWDFCS